MYPFEPLRPAWERLWSAVHESAPWTPPSLAWAGDVHDHWTDPSCRVAHACGWPVATVLRGHVAVVGAFVLDLDDADDHRYRSVMLSTRAVPLADLVNATTRVAASAPDSLSGWISLVAATAVPGGDWPGPVEWTGAHVESLRALQDDKADLACIDPLSLAHVRRLQPELADGLHEVGRGPWIPSPPLVVPVGTDAGLVGHLRRVIADVLAEPALETVRAELLIRGFAGLDDAAYDGLRSLVAVR